MVIVSTNKFRANQKKFFDMAAEEKVLVKRGEKYINLIVTEDPDENSVVINDKWMMAFFSIPAKYRCNPFEISPSGDLFWADRRNVEHMKKRVKQAQKELAEGKIHEMRPKESMHDFLQRINIATNEKKAKCTK